MGRSLEDLTLSPSYLAGLLSRRKQGESARRFKKKEREIDKVTSKTFEFLVKTLG